MIPNMPPVPVEWTQAIPAETQARVIAAVRSEIGKQVTEEQVERRREAEALDAEGCLCCGELTCYFASENVC